jgi:hypothetical protein
VIMVGEQLVVPAPAMPGRAAGDFTAWVADHHRPLLDFAQLVAGDAATWENLPQIALARAYLKWSKISARGEHPLRRPERDRDGRDLGLLEQFRIAGRPTIQWSVSQPDREGSGAQRNA